MNNSNSGIYRGRFAPSPSGPLHLGSLYTALASFLEARGQHGLWLLRIDDADSPRNVHGAADNILKTLTAFGLDWDQEVYYQSQYLDLYQAAITQLQRQDLVYPCICSRKQLAEIDSAHKGIYPGLCRNKAFVNAENYALRLKTENMDIQFNDGLQGRVCQNLAAQHGDFIIKRKDNIIAYQFAVVIDDHQQQITDVVRGFDLLDSTPKQLYLQRVLGFKHPRYLHVPIITDPHGQKLSKQSFATAVDTHNPSKTLIYLLQLLKQQPPEELIKATVTEILTWAIQHWQIAKLQHIHSITPT